MRQWVIIAIGLLFFGTTARAIPARGLPISVKQADGTTITIVVRGDEYSGWTSTTDGYQIVQKEGIYCYYEPQSSRSGAEIKASDPSARSAAEAWALTGRTKGRLDGTGRGDARRMAYPLTQELATGKASASTVVTTPKRSLVLVVQFSDVSLRPAHVQSIFSDLLNTGSTSASQYFSDNSGGLYSPTFDVKGPYTLPHPMAYYGARSGSGSTALDDKDPQQMVIDACQAAAQRGVDFSPYDENKDGRVDNVYIIYAGTNEAEGGGDNTIWPHRWTLQGKPDTRFNGMRIWDYACGSELSIHANSEQKLAGIGTFCHEFGHVLGLPDFYDTDKATNGTSVGLYHFSVMGRGNYNNQGHTPPYYTAIERWLLGWGTLTELTAGEQVTLRPIETQGGGKRISTAEAGEFYVVEVRGSLLWDKYLGGTGLLIYHVDRSNNRVGGSTAAERWTLNTVNSYAAHPCLRLVESSGATVPGLVQPSSDSQIRSGAGKVFYPGSGGVDKFTGSSSGGVDWRGSAVAVELTSITNRNGTVSFATRSSQGTGLPLSFKASQRSVEVRISPLLYSQAAEEGPFFFTAKAEGKMELRTKITGTPNSIAVSGLAPNTAYVGALWATRPADNPPLASANFTTGSLSAPFSALTGLKGTLPIGTVVNLGTTNLASAATKIVFSVNGAGLAGSSYTFSAAGRYAVQCKITYSAEDTEVIERIVTIE